jgi:hypothetical protein
VAQKNAVNAVWNGLQLRFIGSSAAPMGFTGKAFQFLKPQRLLSAEALMLLCTQSSVQLAAIWLVLLIPSKQVVICTDQDAPQNVHKTALASKLRHAARSIVVSLKQFHEPIYLVSALFCCYAGRP